MKVTSASPLSFFDTHFARIYLYDQPHLRFDITPLHQKILADSHASPPSQTIILMNLLKEYFEHPKTFSPHVALPYLTHVSPFQKKVYSALCDIPFGKTLTYLELARKLKTAPRAIGQACKRNPLPCLIPCHRVLAKTHLGGYAGKQDGFFLQVKIELLKHEGIFIDENTNDQGFSKKR